MDDYLKFDIYFIYSLGLFMAYGMDNRYILLLHHHIFYPKLFTLDKATRFELSLLNPDLLYCIIFYLECRVEHTMQYHINLNLSL